MTKPISYISFCLALTFIATSVKAANKSDSLQNHVIFLVHGIGGDSGKEDGRGTFCDKEAIKEKVEASMKRQALQIHAIDYSTKNKDKTTDDFSYEMAKEISGFFESNRNLDSANTTYSIIAHSQGGLVTLRFIKNCLADKLPQCGKTDQLPELDRVTTLGTPFWGSPNATNVHNSENWSNRIREFVLDDSPTGTSTQLESTNASFTLPNGISAKALRDELKAELGLSRPDQESQLEAISQPDLIGSAEFALQSKRQIEKALRELRVAHQNNQRVVSDKLVDTTQSSSTLESTTQLADLTTISQQIVKTRREIVSAFRNEDIALNRILTKIKFINIGGEIRQQPSRLTGLSATARFIIYWAAGSNEETDMVVPVPSSQLSFVAYNNQGQKLQRKEINLVEESMFFPVAHTEFGGRAGMACYDQSILTSDSPEGLLWTSVAANYSSSAKKMTAPKVADFRQPRTYSYEIRVRAEPSTLKKIEIEVEDQDQIRDGMFSQMNHDRLISPQQSSKATESEYVFTATGRLKKGVKKSLRFRIIENGSSRKVLLNWSPIEVHAGKSTFVDIDWRTKTR